VNGQLCQRSLLDDADIADEPDGLLTRLGPRSGT